VSRPTYRQCATFWDYEKDVRLGCPPGGKLRQFCIASWAHWRIGEGGLSGPMRAGTHGTAQTESAPSREMSLMLAKGPFVEGDDLRDILAALICLACNINADLAETKTGQTRSRQPTGSARASSGARGK
jgi:hypothetical protein